MANHPRKLSARKPKGIKIVKMAPEPEVVDTQDDLLLQIGELLTKVDAKMAGKRDQVVSFSRWSHGLLGAEAEQGYKLALRLQKLINPEGLHDLPSSSDLIEKTYQAAPGTVPSWARPGTFLVWIDYVPCRCIWGGFIDPAVEVVAADPKALWLSPAGTVSASQQIYKDFGTPLDLFRDSLQQSTTATTFIGRGRSYNRKTEPAFKLHRLGELAVATAEKVLAMPEHAWLVAALKRGPVDPIPLPPHLQAVQTSLFG
jgi:hypothetical protein